MSRVCDLTGKKALKGNRVSHSNKKTKRRFYPNLQTKKFFIEETGEYITLKVSASTIKTIDKKGITACLDNLFKKGNRVQVILECTEQKGSGVPGMSRYITTKNKKNTPERIELKKYNPYMRKVTLHKEIK